MARRIPALIFIFFCTSVAWMILGSTIMARTYSFSGDLKSKVASTWGVAQEQSPPTASYSRESFRLVTVKEDNEAKEKQIKVTDTVTLPVESSIVSVRRLLRPMETVSTLRK